MVQFFRRFRLQSLSLMHIGTDVVLILLSLFLSLYLRTGTLSLDQHLQALEYWTPIFVALRVFSFIGFGVYLCMWRYVSIPDAVRMAEATALSILLMIAATYFYPGFGTLPRSFFFIDGFVSLGMLTGARLLRRRIYERGHNNVQQTSLSSVMIYGAGTTGRMFAQRIAGNQFLF